MDGPRCLDCRHFYVTWDARFPRGCRAYGVASRELPSVVVLQATGQKCATFVLSERIQKNTGRVRQQTPDT
jgi:hypothetical protein